MNFLDRFRYRYDNLKELDANISSNKKNLNYNNPILKSLLSTSVKVTPEIFPKIDNCIQSVFRKLELKNNFNFFVTANHNQTQASCAMMPESDSAEIIITSRMIELLNINELSYVLGHEISHHYYQHNIYPSPNQAKSKMELLKLLHLSRASEISADRAGFLVLGFSMYFFLFKKYTDLLKILIYFSFLILPITIFVFLNFLNLDKETTILGQEILMKRIPHHADILYWFSYKDVISIIIFLISLILIKDKKKLFISLGVFGFCSIFLSIIQYFLEINSLALIFPWRSSVFLIPISSIIIISFLIDKIKGKLFNKKKLILTIFFSISIFFGLKSHVLENLNNNFEKKIFLFNEIKEYYNEIDSILVPIDTVSIRLNTGLPIFINHKHHPFKHNEIIDWNLRVKLASNFYNAKNLISQNQFLKEIIEIEKISHILFKKSQFYPECKDLINNKDYILIDISDCYKN